MADLAVLADLKERLGITGTNPTESPDAYLENLIDRATGQIEALVGREIDSATYTEFHDGDGTPFLNLRRGPVSSVTSVDLWTYDSAGSGSSGDSLTANVDFFLPDEVTESDWRLPGYLVHAVHWQKGWQNYKVIYVAGWTTIPEDIVEATLHAAVWMHNKRKDAATSARTISDGSMVFSQSYKDLVMDLRSLLSPYISTRLM